MSSVAPKSFKKLVQAKDSQCQLNSYYPLVGQKATGDRKLTTFQKDWYSFANAVFPFSTLFEEDTLYTPVFTGTRSLIELSFR